MQADGKLHPVSYASRALNESQKRYGITELETLAVVWGISHFHHFHYRHNVTIYTDHTAVKAVLEAENPTAKRARWWTRVYGRGVRNVKILYRAGRENTNADALSRSPHLPAPVVGIGEDEVEVSTIAAEGIWGNSPTQPLPSTECVALSLHEFSQSGDEEWSTCVQELITLTRPAPDVRCAGLGDVSSARPRKRLLGEATLLCELPFPFADEDRLRPRHKIRVKPCVPPNHSKSTTSRMDMAIESVAEDVAMLSTSILSPQSLPGHSESGQSLHLPPTPPRNISIVQTEGSVTMTLVYRLLPLQPDASRGEQQMASASLGHQTPEYEELTTPQGSTDSLEKPDCPSSRTRREESDGESHKEASLSY